MKKVLAIIVLSQFFCTSLWFAGNAVLPDLIHNFDRADNVLANITSAVQFGFITGTLVFAIFTIADRFPPSKVFCICAIVAAVCNSGLLLHHISFPALLSCRFLTGFFLAGIYPVGMKIASDYFEKGLGSSLGFLVGALVLGTAFPHLLKTFTTHLPWKYVVYSTSLLSVAGGLAIAVFVPDGPYRKAAQQPNLKSFLRGFQNKKFRSAAFGYFGHMWELYAFWAFVPVILQVHQNRWQQPNMNISLFAFLIIASGSVACVAAGQISKRLGEWKVAANALSMSCMCCLLSPIFILQQSMIILIIFLLFWGMVVVADSPMFSTMVARNAPPESRGSSLTLVNCVGFAITIVSIEFINLISASVRAEFVYVLLSTGPLLGLYALFQSKPNKQPDI